MESEFRQRIDEVSRVDGRLDARMSGLLTADGFVLAAAAFLVSGGSRGLTLAASIVALASGYMILTAQQYVAEPMPGRDPREELEVVYEFYKSRYFRTQVATLGVGVALLMIVWVIGMGSL